MKLYLSNFGDYLLDETNKFVGNYGPLPSQINSDTRLSMKLTCDRHTERYGQGLRALHKPPGACEVASAHSLVGVHFQWVVVAAAEDAVHLSI